MQSRLTFGDQDGSILITGSNGLIGRGFIEHSPWKSRDLIRFDIAHTEDAPGRGDVTRTDQISSSVAGCTGIVHLAAVSRVVWGEEDPEKCWETNVEGTRNVLNAALQSENRPWVLVASSREVYGEPTKCPVQEGDPLEPVNIYGRSKVQAEKLALEARECGLRTAVVRLSNVYGSIQDHSDRVIPAFARAAALGGAIRVDGPSNTFDFTHLGDTVRGLYSICELLDEGVDDLPPIHLLTGHPTTLGELAELATSLGSMPCEVTTAPSRSYDVSHFFGNPGLAKRLLGWEPQVSLRVGLERLIREFEQTTENSTQGATQ